MLKRWIYRLFSEQYALFIQNFGSVVPKTTVFHKCLDKTGLLENFYVFRKHFLAFFEIFSTKLLDISSSVLIAAWSFIQAKGTVFLFVFFVE
jgi:hypothetical protein